MTLSHARKATKAEAGRMGALKRWAGHERRIVRMAELTPEEQGIVRALLRLRDARESSPPTTEPSGSS